MLKNNFLGIVFALDEDSLNKPINNIAKHYTDDFDADVANEDDGIELFHTKG